jgi:hypothetical protein
MAYPVVVWSVLPTKYYLCNEIPISEIGRAYGTYGEEERCIEGVSGETQGKEIHLEDLDVDGTIILNWILKNWKVVRWIDLILVTNKWRAVVHAVMKFGVHKMRGMY